MNSQTFHAQNRYVQKVKEPIIPYNPTMDRRYIAIATCNNYTVVLAACMINDDYRNVLMVSDANCSDGSWTYHDLSVIPNSQSDDTGPRKADGYLGYSKPLLDHARTNTVNMVRNFTLLQRGSDLVVCWLNVPDPTKSYHDATLGQLHVNVAEVNYHINTKTLRVRNLIRDNRKGQPDRYQSLNGDIRNVQFAISDSYDIMSAINCVILLDSDIWYRDVNNLASTDLPFLLDGWDRFVLLKGWTTETMHQICSAGYKDYATKNAILFTNEKWILTAPLWYNKVAPWSAYRQQFDPLYSMSDNITQARMLHAHHLFGDEFIILSNRYPGRILMSLNWLDDNVDYEFNDGTNGSIKAIRCEIQHDSDEDGRLLFFNPHLEILDGESHDSYTKCDIQGLGNSGSFSHNNHGFTTPRTLPTVWTDDNFFRNCFQSCTKLNINKINHIDTPNHTNTYYVNVDYWIRVGVKSDESIFGKWFNQQFSGDLRPNSSDYIDGDFTNGIYPPPIPNTLKHIVRNEKGKIVSHDNWNDENQVASPNNSITGSTLPNWWNEPKGSFMNSGEGSEDTEWELGRRKYVFKTTDFCTFTPIAMDTEVLALTPTKLAFTDHTEMLYTTGDEFDSIFQCDVFMNNLALPWSYDFLIDKPKYTYGRLYNWCAASSRSYGMLYNWYTATDVKNIAPIGWHVPTKAEFDILIAYLGGGSVAGGKLKETGTTYWNSPNTGATNEAGFNAIGGGYRDAQFSSLNSYLYYWSSTSYDTSNAYFININYNSGVLVESNVSKIDGFRLRLIKDDSTDLGLITGNDGKQYPTVKIGTQVWLAQNLEETKFRDGSTIPVVTDNTTWSNLTTAGACWYDNIRTYDLAPAGWHLPNANDFTTLVTHAGGTDIAGGILKETGLIHWNDPNTGATNESGFTALGSGFRSTTFTSIKNTNSLYATNDVLNLGYNSTNAPQNNIVSNKFVGMSVRFIRNINSVLTTPPVDTEGNVYETVTIGTQIWTKQNHKSKKWRTSENINVQDIYTDVQWAALNAPACCAFGDDESNV